MRRIGAAVVAAALAAASPPPAGAAPVAALTVHVSRKAAATALRLQPGFATVLRADHRIDTVAIGDPRLVTATAVRRGQDAYDLVLQPQAEGGSTNMVVWFGDLATVWELEIGPGPRTADVVYVVTSGAADPPKPARSSGADAPAASPPAPAAGGRSTGAAATPSRPPAVRPGPGAPASAAPGAPPARPPAPSTAPVAAGSAAPGTPAAAGQTGPPLLEVRQTIGPIAGVFQVTRIASGVVIRYRITNESQADLVIRPGGVLVRVNGRVAPYAMARDSVDRGRPDVLPRGAMETGIVDVPGAAAREVRLILSLFPATAEATAGVALPTTFQTTFTGVDRLLLLPAP